MTGVTHYSIQPFSFYAKEQFLFWDQPLSAYSYLKTEKSRQRKERVKCTIKCVSGPEFIVAESLSQFHLYCFLKPTSTLKPTGN